MAHTCPECGQTCYCNGDVDDIDWGEDSEESILCVHYMKCEKEYANGEEDEPCWEEEGGDDVF